MHGGPFSYVCRLHHNVFLRTTSFASHSVSNLPSYGGHNNRGLCAACIFRSSLHDVFHPTDSQTFIQYLFTLHQCFSALAARLLPARSDEGALTRATWHAVTIMASLSTQQTRLQLEEGRRQPTDLLSFAPIPACTVITAGPARHKMQSLSYWILTPVPSIALGQRCQDEQKMEHRNDGSGRAENGTP